MSDAPERLWVGKRGYWGFPNEGATEYIRADLRQAALPTPAPMTVAQAARVLLADVIANCGTDEDAWLPVLDGILRHCDGDRNNAMSGLVAALAAITEAKP